jgi:hypothetical protein
MTLTEETKTRLKEVFAYLMLAATLATIVGAALVKTGII